MPSAGRRGHGQLEVSGARRSLARAGRVRGHGANARRPKVGGGVDARRRAGEGATCRGTGEGGLERELKRERER